jgi:hypothetical protein
MNSKKKQRRVVNFNKEDFDKIRKYCDDRALDMSKWIVKITFDKINKGEI